MQENHQKAILRRQLIPYVTRSAKKLLLGPWGFECSVHFSCQMSLGAACVKRVLHQGRCQKVLEVLPTARTKQVAGNEILTHAGEEAAASVDLPPLEEALPRGTSGGDVPQEHDLGNHPAGKNNLAHFWSSAPAGMARQQEILNYKCRLHISFKAWSNNT